MQIRFKDKLWAIWHQIYNLFEASLFIFKSELGLVTCLPGRSMKKRAMAICSSDAAHGSSSMWAALGLTQKCPPWTRFIIKQGWCCQETSADRKEFPGWQNTRNFKGKYRKSVLSLGTSLASTWASDSKRAQARKSCLMGPFSHRHESSWIFCFVWFGEWTTLASFYWLSLLMSWLGICQLDTSLNYLGRGMSIEKMPPSDCL